MTVTVIDKQGGLTYYRNLSTTMAVILYKVFKFIGGFTGSIVLKTEE